MVHSFKTEIAEDVGVVAAVIFNYIEFRCRSNADEKKGEYDGKFWARCPLEWFQNKFPYLSKDQVRYAIEKLEKNGYIVEDVLNDSKYDRTKWYSLSDKEWNKQQEQDTKHLSPDDDNLCEKAQKLARRKRARRVGITESIVELTPIEQMFAIALETRIKNSKKLDRKLQYGIQQKIKPRYSNNTYIVDFVIFGIEGENRLTPLIIELDGKEYHSSTEQINHDYARANELMRDGYAVMRFTGSQIYANATACVRQAIQIFYELNGIRRRK